METLLAFGGLSPWELLIVVLVIVLLFGSAKIPQLMRGLGSGINEFKKGIKEGEKDAAAEAKDGEKKDPAPAPPAESEKK